MNIGSLDICWALGPAFAPASRFASDTRSLLFSDINNPYKTLKAHVATAKNHDYTGAQLILRYDFRCCFRRKKF